MLFRRSGGRGLPHALPSGLQAERLVAVVGLQCLLRQRAENQVQMASGEAVQRWAAMPQTRPEESGEMCAPNREASLSVGFHHHMVDRQ